jgi:hypothetical protein
MAITLAQVLISFALAIPLLYIYSRYQSSGTQQADTDTDTDKPNNDTDTDTDMSSNLIPANNNSLSPLPPPKDDPFTLDQLKEFDGTDSSKPIYISIKGK